MLNFYPPFLCRVLAAILKMADILKILKTQNFSSNGGYSPFFPCTMNLSTADLRNYRTEFHETWWSYRYMFLVDPEVFRFIIKIINYTLTLSQLVTRYDYNLTIMKSPKPATDAIYPLIVTLASCKSISPPFLNT
jgi:hypothetical protein